MKMTVIPLSQAERDEVFENDAEAMAKARTALELVRARKIDGVRFLRLMDNYKGLALARFTRHCAEIARNRIRSGWVAVNAREVAL